MRAKEPPRRQTGHDPGKASGGDFAAEMDLDVPGRPGRQLALRGVEQQRGHVQTQLTMQRVAAATGQHAGPRAHRRLPRHVYLHALVRARYGGHASAAHELGTGANGLVRQSLIEERAVYDHGLDHASAVNDLLTCGGNETSGGQLVEDGVGREAELVEGLSGKNACAVDGIADDLVLFEDGDAKPLRRQLTCCLQSRRACANDDRVIHHQRTSFHIDSSTVNVDRRARVVVP